MDSLLTPSLWGLAVLLVAAWVRCRAPVPVRRKLGPMLVLGCAGMGAGLVLDLRAGAGPLLTSICGQSLPLSLSLPWLMLNLPASNAGMLLAPLLWWVVQRRHTLQENHPLQQLHPLLMSLAMLLGMNLSMALMPASQGPYRLQLVTMVLAMAAGMIGGMSAVDTAMLTYEQLIARKAR